ncbi:hypothetical protein PVAND_007234 [Polypedilum vanderplanki]|uniref:Uncharacterized protein n=1 Tax=Polypedilum vanderplanki TaxID=319348 RepID=A0A9J6C5L7_POLVA|nr:hypothetical protein PVAND_007234 [Polypedilum vanderplanki]
MDLFSGLHSKQLQIIVSHNILEMDDETLLQNIVDKAVKFVENYSQGNMKLARELYQMIYQMFVECIDEIGRTIEEVGIEAYLQNYNSEREE